MVDQPTLFDPPAARTTDPVTSHKAAQHLGVKRTSQQGQLLEVFAHALSPLSMEECAEIAGVLNTRQCWWKRISELAHKGLLDVVGTTISAAGEEVQTYRISDRGYEVAAVWRMDDARKAGK